LWLPAYNRKVTDEEEVIGHDKYQFRPDMNEIIERVAKKFGLKRTGSIPTVIGKLKAQLKLDKNLKDKVKSAR
jgi:hypothetical protein